MQRKKLLKLIVGVTLVTVLAIALPLAGGCIPAPEVAPPEPTAEEPIYHWRVALLWMPTELELIAQPWADQLEESLGGRVTIDIYGGGELMPLEQEFPALQDGTLDIAQFSGDFMAVPMDIVYFETAPPFAWKSPAEALTLLRSYGLEELLAEAYEELGGVHYLGACTADPLHVLSSKPIRTYEDLEGLKINGAANFAQPFTEAGAVSTLLELEDIYLSGKTGVVDAIMWCGAKEGVSNSWHEVYPYFLTNAVVGAGLNHFLINKEVWDSLPSDMQAILTMSIRDLEDRCLAYYYKGEPESREYFTLTTLSDEDWAKLREHAMKRWDELALTSPRYAQVVQLIRDYNAHVEAVGWYR